jgi:hypothetical protein
MSLALIGLVFCLGFFVESIIGAGGSLIAFAILGFFIDIKQLILMSIYIATTASIFVLASDYRSFSKAIFIKYFPFCLFGTIIGGLFFVHSNSQVIILIFGIFLLFLASKIMFFDDIKLSKKFTKVSLIVGGISHGVFGVGGPFFAVALKNHFKNKSEMRTTLATFFITFNLIRICQFSLYKTLDFDLLFSMWWVAAPLAISIHLGHLVHKKLSESIFKKLLVALATFSGIAFLFKK